MSTNSVAAAWYNVVGRVVSMLTIYRQINDGRQRVRSLRGERRNSAFSVEWHVARTVGVTGGG
ncbi:hypothetical protein BDFB_008870 [Asbolus verrucosus]|uniref:Uncharacterized protein n=1 Tax=Asbolus verrucosus TaxID=1661398 RepID=A0A482W0K7_ASBVE|nr:hypothetical protein BDFB_008870 [Asbolus verrucosus]